MKASFHVVAGALNPESESTFGIMSQMRPAKGGIEAQSTDLATLLQLHLDRNLRERLEECRPLLSC